LSNEGKKILKLQTTGDGGSGSGGTDANGNGSGDMHNEKNSTGSRSSTHTGGDATFMFKQDKLSSRANRQNELHSSNLAGN
jgi:hypothetical protein